MLSDTRKSTTMMPSNARFKKKNMDIDHVGRNLQRGMGNDRRSDGRRNIEDRWKVRTIRVMGFKK